MTLDFRLTNMPRRISKQIHTQILKADKILLVPHQNPDGDALGSIASFVQYFKRIKKPHKIFCDTQISPSLQYLPHLDKITNDPKVWQDKTYDLVIVLDSGDLRYAGVDHHISNSSKKRTLINIDHHPTNEMYGDYNLVLPKASSTAEILYYFFRHNKIEFDKYISTSLLTGIITDTDNFTNAATTITSYSIASDLINKGANLNLIRGSVFKDKSINTLKLWGKVLSRLTKHEELDIVHTYIAREDLTNLGVSDTDTEGISNFLNTIGDGRACLILKELPNGKIKGSFRTTRDDTDVSQLALIFGGGGHKKAAGFTLEGPREQAIKHVFDKIIEAERLKTKN